MNHEPDIHARHEHLPEGFTRRTTGKCPYPPEARVELMIKTKEGIGSSGITKAGLHDWSVPSSKIGGIVGHRLV